MSSEITATETPTVNRYFQDLGRTNTTLESADRVLFYVADYHLRAASLVFREMLEMPDPSKDSKTRHHINLDESSQIVEDMLLAITRSPEAAAAFFSQRKLDHLNSLLAVCDKYQIETHVWAIRHEVRKTWTVDQPLAALKQAVSWRDTAVIASIVAFGNEWSAQNKESMAPWGLSDDMPRLMGLDLHQCYTWAFFRQFSMTAGMGALGKLLLVTDDGLQCRIRWTCDWTKVAEELMRYGNWRRPSVSSSS